MHRFAPGRLCLNEKEPATQRRDGLKSSAPAKGGFYWSAQQDNANNANPAARPASADPQR